MLRSRFRALSYDLGRPQRNRKGPAPSRKEAIKKPPAPERRAETTLCSGHAAGARSTAGGEARQVSAMSPDHLPRLQPGRKTVMGDRVLVVDDDLSILRVVAANLRARGYEALTAASGTVALTVIETQQPDCIVLDLGLPDIDGLEVLRRLRTWTTTPVVILTAVGDERDKATALDLGADDYVTKPFAMAELLARVRGALRHGQSSQNLNRPRRIQTGPVCIDLDAGAVTRWGATGTTDPHRVPAPRDPGHQQGPALHQPRPIRAPLGDLGRAEGPIASGSCGQPAPQARRPIRARAAGHRTGHGLPLHRANLSSRRSLYSPAATAGDRVEGGG